VLYWVYRCIVKIVSLLPYSLVLAIGRLLGALYYLLIKKQVNLARSAICEHLAVSREEAGKITKAMCRNIGMTFMEILYMPALNAANIRQFVKIEREEALREAIAEKKGVVVLAIHMDNWEWLGAALSLYGYPLTSFIKKQPGESVNRILEYLRTKVGIELFTRGTGETVAAARAMKKGKMLGFIADQDGGRDGIFVPFLGTMASTPAGPAFFAQKFKAPIVPIFIVRDPGGGHKTIVCDKFYYEDTGDQQKDMYNCTRKMTGIVEGIIRRYPDNWLWFQRRWNTPYPGAGKGVPGDA
jgi:KDO2-lipid IV(A) lauroyltransferase